MHKCGEARHCRSADGRRDHVLPELVAPKLEAALQEVAHHGRACARGEHAQPCGVGDPASEPRHNLDILPWLGLRPQPACLALRGSMTAHPLRGSGAGQ